MITKIDDTDVSTGVELQSELYKHKVGDTVKVTYYRQDKKNTVSVKLSIDANSLKSNSQQQSNQ